MAIRPGKNSHPDQTTLAAALHILKYLKKRRLEHYDNLLVFMRKQVLGGEVLFLPALNFLFMLGLVEYRPKTDVLEYTG